MTSQLSEIVKILSDANEKRIVSISEQLSNEKTACEMLESEYKRIQIDQLKAAPVSSSQSMRLPKISLP